MSEKKDHKNEMVLAPSDAADLLRRLADQLEAGGVEIGEVTVENDGPVKIKQSVKTKSDKVSFKLKLKYETALTPELSGALGELPEEEPEDDEDAAPMEESQPKPAESAESKPAKPKKADKTKKAGKADAKAKQAKSSKGKGKGKDNKDSYKSLKKSMGKSFKSLKKALAEEKPPSVDDINQFAADCELMTTFSDKGDAKYKDFLHHVGDLKAAAEAGDFKALDRAMAEINAMKKSCHEEYK
jgi:XXXCH domain-containing protein